MAVLLHTSRKRRKRYCWLLCSKALPYGGTPAAKVCVISPSFFGLHPLSHILTLLFNSCSVSTAHSAFGQVKRTHEAVNELGAKHIFATESLIRCVLDCWLSQIYFFCYAMCSAYDVSLGYMGMRGNELYGISFGQL